MEIATRRREQEVWQACDDLWSMHGIMQGLTGDAIRDRLVSLGKSKGSPNEIYKYRKTWIQSRGLMDKPHIPEVEFQDPIARAVKLVHEQLKLETSEEISQLKQDFDHDLALKEQEIFNTKKALDGVMVEFNQLRHTLDEKNLSLRSLEEKLLAEIEVRKASERELLMVKSLREQERLASEMMLKEIKDLHKKQLTQIEQQEEMRQISQKDLLEKLMEEKKQLGFEYSEKLNELRTIIYNHDVINKQLKDEAVRVQQDNEHLSSLLATKNKQMDMVKDEHSKLASLYSAQQAQLILVKDQCEQKARQEKQLAHQMKKSELTIARLRAMLNKA
jgi:hypothetical protein